TLTMTLQEEIQNLSTLFAETVQKISALEAKYKNPSGLLIISKPKLKKEYSKYFGENNWAYYEAIKQVMQDR
ncbi:15013_t:CDS:2, partial [Dentiscutata erythropus]